MSVYKKIRSATLSLSLSQILWRSLFRHSPVFCCRNPPNFFSLFLFQSVPVTFSPSLSFSRFLPSLSLFLFSIYPFLTLSTFFYTHFSSYSHPIASLSPFRLSFALLGRINFWLHSFTWSRRIRTHLKVHPKKRRLFLPKQILFDKSKKNIFLSESFFLHTWSVFFFSSWCDPQHVAVLIKTDYFSAKIYQSDS